MRRVSGSLGLNGLVLLCFAMTALVVTEGEMSFFVIGNAIVGLFCVIAWLTSSRDGLSTFLGKRSTRYGANAIVASSLLVGIVVMGNFLATRYTLRWDMTESKVFSLSPQSIQVVAVLEQDLELIGFVEAGIDPALRDLFDSYARGSDRVSTRLVDPDVSPDLAERYRITNYNTVRVAYGEQAKLVTDPGEQTITNAIIQLTQAEKKSVCLVEGHGEADSNDIADPRGNGVFRQALENENYEVRTVLLATLDGPPNYDCDLLIVSGAPKPWLEQEMTLLGQYLEAGGNALFLVSATRDDQFSEVLAGYGLNVGKNAVIDQVVRLFQGPALGLDPIVARYGSHPITTDFTERTIFPLARTLEPEENTPDGITVTALAFTSESSWAESDVSGIFENSEATLDPSVDRRGPLAVASAAQRTGPDEKNGARIVAFGSDQMVNNKFINHFFNRDLVLNAAGWTVGEENLISIRPRSVRASRVQLTTNQVTQIFYLSVLILPELLLLVGIAVWSSRRNA